MTRRIRAADLFCGAGLEVNISSPAILGRDSIEAGARCWELRMGGVRYLRSPTRVYDLEDATDRVALIYVFEGVTAF